MQYIEAFVEAIQAAGIVPPSDLLADGKLHRFSSDGSRKKNGWYVLFGDEPAAGSFGCWKMDISEKWCRMSLKDLDPENRARFKARIEAAKKEQDEDKARLNDECRAWCIKTWNQNPYADDNHPYLRKKKVCAHKVKLIGDSLMIPFYDVNGVMHGMQFIRPDGTKTFKVGTNKKCHFFLIGTLTDQTLLICEGYATGASLHEATGYSVAVAFDAGNMLSVAEALRKKHPNMQQIICADNDQFNKPNTGILKATEVARVVKGLLAVPKFQDLDSKPTDFNDLQVLEGLEVVKQQVMSAVLVEPESVQVTVDRGSKAAIEIEPLPLIRPMQANEPFPVHALPNVMKSAVLKVHEIIQSPMDLISQSFLAAVTLAAQAYADVTIDGRQFPISNKGGYPLVSR